MFKSIYATIAGLKMFYLAFFLFFLAFGVPIVYVMLLAPGIDLAMHGQTRFFAMLIQRWVSGIDSFPLMALPFFILAGDFMSAGGVTIRMVRFAESLIGHLRAGLAHVCVLASVMLAGGSGSAVADASALGSMLIPAMNKLKYPAGFSAAVVSAAGILAPIIPPSGLMIMYAFIQNVSVAAMFAGGIIPGLLMAGAMMAVIALKARTGIFPPPKPRAPLTEVWASFRQAILPMGTPIILLGGILGGIMTPTEAAGIAAAYALLLGLFYTKEIKFADLPRLFSGAAFASAKILLLVGAAVAFASVVSLRQTPQMMGAFLVSITDDPLLLFFIINLFLLGVGCIMDAGPTILILAPILAPVMTSVGVDPVHFAVVMVINLTIGLITPPMGLVLFVTAGISRLGIDVITRNIIGLFLANVGVVFLITYFPQLVLWLPTVTGIYTP
ncbi:TRAP transporter large permease [Desulfovibrio sp. OttesenSCG-928-I05]|nr:TRAP transporter large permease [Desulfovibrio sp. OttesenSCG-928-I05]